MRKSACIDGRVSGHAETWENTMSISRRHFLRTAAAASGTVLALQRSAHASGSDILKVGLIGCGGRGTGAAANALNADPGVRIVALADAFDDRIQGALKQLKQLQPDRVDVEPSRCYVGFDCYKQLIAGDVDVVLLAAPPHFRALHLAAAIEAGKHVFAEKPVGVDATGVRSVLATCELAKKKNLCVVSGLCWRYDTVIRETIKRIHDGAIGDIMAVQTSRNLGSLWHRPRQPEWTEMEFQMRNWYYFTWLGGDHNVEQQIHGIDKCTWALKDKAPATAWAVSGRQVRVDSKYGNIYDHHAVVYEYDDGSRMYALARQQPNCYNDYSEVLFGTKGRCDLQKGQITGETNWSHGQQAGDLSGYSGKRTSNNGLRPMHQVEQDEMFAAIRAGKCINNGDYMCQSTLIAIMGRTAGYTGQKLTWQQMTESKLDLSPEKYTFDATPPILPGPDGSYPIATPGVTEFV
ncbi:MAG: Gfo/Idh/MocA family oxidoreductase [Planctomycetaceae bacterium]|nr:Gfo/Idh/MocA family oxidoreductase [Planctomycetaceae bacterium]